MDEIIALISNCSHLKPLDLIPIHALTSIVVKRYRRWNFGADGIRAWISNYDIVKLWDSITPPHANFNVGLAKSPLK